MCAKGSTRFQLEDVFEGILREEVQGSGNLLPILTFRGKRISGV